MGTAHWFIFLLTVGWTGYISYRLFTKRPLIWRKACDRDHDIKDSLPSSTATEWYHSYSCPKCHSPVGHREFMTKICLTCGQEMGGLPDSSAYRSIARGGKWVRQKNADRPLLELRKGLWLPPQEYDLAARSFVDANYSKIQLSE